MPEIERRTVVCEIRSKSDDGMSFTGYAARFNEETYVGPPKQGFYERIAPGAFAKALTKNDTRALFNHNADYVLGRMSSGTLRLEEDAEGLLANIDLPQTTWGRDIAELVKRGDISGMSFAFTVATGGEQWASKPGGHAQVRTITEYDVLQDVGPVTFPAYDTTTASVRSQVMQTAMPTAPAKRGQARDGSPARVENRGWLVDMVQATDATVDAAAVAVAAGNGAQALNLLQAALLAISETVWALYGTDMDLLAALGCGDVMTLANNAWDAICDAIAALDSADGEAVQITAAIDATDLLLAALRLPDADAPATDVEGETSNDDTARSADIDRAWLAATSLVINE